MNIIELKIHSLSYTEVINALCKQLSSSSGNISENYLRQIIESENSHLFLAIENEDVLGMLTVGVYKTPTGIKAWIEDVVVDNKARGKGLGRKIIQHAIDFTKSIGASTLMLTSNPARVAANELYQSMGFELKDTNMYKMDI